MRKLSTNDVKVALTNTLVSIEMSKAGGKLSPEARHPINRVEGAIAESGELANTEVASLLAERLAIQGFVLYHDEDAAREYLSKGLARVEGFLRE